MTDIETKHAGICQVLIKEFEMHQLPCLLIIKAKVENGDVLSDGDIEFLHRVINDARYTIYLTIICPELHDFYICEVYMFRKITKKALKNEENNIFDFNSIFAH